MSAVCKVFYISLNEKKRLQPARKAVRELACRSSIGELFQRTAPELVVAEALFHSLCVALEKQVCHMCLLGNLDLMVSKIGQLQHTCNR